MKYIKIFEEFLNEAKKIRNRIFESTDMAKFKPTNGWKQFEGDEMNSALQKFVKKKNAFKYDGNWIEAWYKGNPETTSDWILITDDGGFYKVDAEWMIWFPKGAQAIWSLSHLPKALKHIMSKGTILRDPNYQT